MFGSRLSRKSSAIVEMTATTVRKRVDQRFLAIEAEVARAAAALGRASGMFYAPRVLNCNVADQLLEIERIPGVTSLSQLLAEQPGRLDILQRAGKALAYIHRDLEVPPEYRIRLEPHLLAAGNEVCLHGDYNTLNVGYKHADDMLVIWDWASSPILDRRITVGPRCFDLAHFLRSLLVHQPAVSEASRLFRLRANAFLIGYRQVGAWPIAPSVLRQSVMTLVKFRMRQQVRRGSLLSALTNIRYYLLLSKLTEHLYV